MPTNDREAEKKETRTRILTLLDDICAVQRNIAEIEMTLRDLRDKKGKLVAEHKNLVCCL